MPRVYPDLTHARLLEVLRYKLDESDPWVWIANTGTRNRIGNKAGCVSKDLRGHERRTIGIDGQEYISARLAWFYMKGEWPPKGYEIDHINGDSLDDRWENLRLATRSQQLMNIRAHKDNRSGYKGVRLHKKTGLFQARIQKDKKSISLGYFETRQEAHEVYCEAARQMFGEFTPDRADRTKERTDRADYCRTVDGVARMFVEINGVEYPAERLAWFYVYGKWPNGKILFKDGNPLNLKLDNLVEESA